MITYLRLIRPPTGIIAAIAVWIGTIIAGGQLLSLPIVLGMVSAFLIASGGMAINDFFDAETDKLNKPHRPVATGKISKRAALALSAVLFFIGAAISYFINFDAFVLAVLASCLLAAYSHLKKTMIIGYLVISGLAAMAFLYGGFIVGNYVPLLSLALLVFISNVAREIYKSINDALEDKKYNEHSLAVKFGVINARILANIFLIITVIFSFLPYFLGLLGVTYLFFVVISDIVFLSAVIAPVRYGSKLVLIGIVIAVFAFLAGAVRI